MQLITPVTYINSAADLKAFCGEHGGIVCTSSNAANILEWSLARREKVLFFPDQHLGRWTGFKMGIPLDDMVVWDPDLENGGLTREQVAQAKILLWKGHCSVHQMFQPAHIVRWRNQHPDGLVISHPESAARGVPAIGLRRLDRIHPEDGQGRRPNTKWLVGTELNLVNRLAEEVKHEGKTVQFMAPTVCMCSTMQRIDPQHLAWCWRIWPKARSSTRSSKPDQETGNRHRYGLAGRIRPGPLCRRTVGKRTDDRDHDRRLPASFPVRRSGHSRRTGAPRSGVEGDDREPSLPCTGCPAAG
jgi:quinolinate synthase